MRLSGIFLRLAVLGSFSCTKAPLMEDRFSTFSYQQTYCFDPWGYGTTDSATADSLMAYLTARQLPFHSIGIRKTGTAEPCNACTCKTGNELYVTLLFPNARTEDEYRKMGFKPVPEL